VKTLIITKNPVNMKGSGSDHAQVFPLERFVKEPLALLDEAFHRHGGDMGQAEAEVISQARMALERPEALASIPFLDIVSWRKEGSVANNSLVRFRGMVQVTT